MKALLVFALLLPTLLWAESPTEAFAANICGQLETLVDEAALLDVEGRDRGRERRKLQRRQAELDRWYRREGKALDPEATVEERAKLILWRSTLANRDILAMATRERRDWQEAMHAQIQGYRQHLAPSLAAVLDRAAPSFVPQALANPPTLAATYFPVQRQRRLYALSFPDQGTTLLNLNAAAREPSHFFDAFEHETWHHLLPPPDKMTENPWYEGFIEAVSLSFAAEFYRRFPDGLAADQEAEYPVQTAWASLHLAADRAHTLAWLGGKLSTPAYRQKLAGGNVLARGLAKIHELDTHVNEEALEALLRDWRWKEDDGSHLQLDVHLEDGRLSNTRLTQLFVSNRLLYNDLSAARAVLGIRVLQAVAGLDLDGAAKDLSPALRQNLRTVLLYARQPTQQFDRFVKEHHP